MLRLDRSNSFKSIIQKIKIFFRSQKWNEMLIFLFFLLLSLGFWYLQALKKDFEVELEVPLQYINMPNDMIVHGEKPNAIVVKVKDKGTVLIKYTLLHRFNPILLDLSQIKKEDKRQIIFTERTLEEGVSKQLNPSTSLMSIHPSSIQLEWHELKTVLLPVLPDLTVNTLPGFQVSDSILISPDSIRVYASTLVLDSLKLLTTYPQTIEQADRQKKIMMKVFPIPGVRFEKEEVMVIIPIEEFTEKRVILPVLCDSIPEGFHLRIFPAEVEVICNIPLSRFKELSEDDLTIRYPFELFEANQQSGKIILSLTMCPSWIMSPQIIPEEIEFIIEKENP